MTETVEITRNTLKDLIQMHSDATQLLEEIPRLQDEGRLSEASQHIGAELEARITKMNEIQKHSHEVDKILDEIGEKQDKNSLEQLEKEVLG